MSTQETLSFFPEEPREGVVATLKQADSGRVVERFVRLEASRSEPGSGLGLSLVSAVAQLHGGVLKLEDNGPGLRAVLDLPRRARQLPTPPD